MKILGLITVYAAFLASAVWFKPRAFVVISASMEPAVSKGSLVLTLPSGKYEVGDIVAFEFEHIREAVVTHRIIAAKNLAQGYLYSTKGDANSYEDAVPVSNKKVIGKVIASLPFAGNILSNPWAFILLVYFPLGFALGAQVRATPRCF